MSKILVFIISIIIIQSYSIINAQDLSSFHTELDTRSTFLGNYEYVWKLSSQVSLKGVSSEILGDKIKESRQRAEQRIIKNHVTDESTKQSYFASEETLTRTLFTKKATSSFSVFKFSRIGNNLSVYGEVTDPMSHLKSISHQIYYGNFAIFYGENASTKTIQNILPSIPLVLGSSGDAIYQRMGNGTFLDLSPIEVSILTNTNPLKMFDSKWELISEKNNVSYFNHNLDDSGRVQHYSIAIGRNYKFLISCNISGDGTDYQFSYKTMHTRNFKNYQIPDVVEHTRKVGDYVSVDTWTLEKIAQAKPISLGEIPKKMMISDTRLKGINLTSDQVDEALNWDSPNYLQYPWSGYLPDINELRKISKDFNSKHVTSHSNSNLTLFLPGVLLIAAGVFLKLRKSRKEKESALPAPKK